MSLMQEYRGLESSQKHSNIAQAVRFSLSVAASAVLGRGLRTAGRPITASRSLIDSKVVQMVMLLDGREDVIHEEMPVFSDGQVKDAIPAVFPIRPRMWSCCRLGQQKETSQRRKLYISQVYSTLL